MSPPQYQQSPLDPALAQLMQSSQDQDIAAMQEKLRGDNASILARYGQRQALATGTASPISPAVTPSMGAGF